MGVGGELLRGWRRFAPGVLVALAIGIGGCQSDEKDEYVERPVDELYNDAMDRMEEGDHRQAAKVFDEVERQHPYSPWATRAQLMAGFAHYQANQYDEAIVAIDRFIELHPAHPDVPYALYLKGLCYYERISTVDRDQEMTERARESFDELITRYPNSEYARAAKVKMELAIDNLAGKEMVVGRFYLKQRNYLAAINRFKRVVDAYQGTTHVPEALLRMTEAYVALGLRDEARKTAAVLGHNYPESEWYADAYALVGSSLAVPAGG